MFSYTLAFMIVFLTDGSSEPHKEALIVQTRPLALHSVLPGPVNFLIFLCGPATYLSIALGKLNICSLFSPVKLFQELKMHFRGITINLSEVYPFL